MDIWISMDISMDIHGKSVDMASLGRSPLEAETLFVSECSMKTANLPMFLKFGNAKDHQTLLNFAILAGKWQKMHLFI